MKQLDCSAVHQFGRVFTGFHSTRWSKLCYAGCKWKALDSDAIDAEMHREQALGGILVCPSVCCWAGACFQNHWSPPRAAHNTPELQVSQNRMPSKGKHIRCIDGMGHGTMGSTSCEAQRLN